MNEDWWEKPSCFVCDNWWLILLLLALILAAFFTRFVWLDLQVIHSSSSIIETEYVSTETVFSETVQSPTVTAFLETVQSLTMMPPIQADVIPKLGTGDVQVTLIWNTNDDLDLWVTDPDGFKIYFNRKNSPSGGELDIDANAGCSGARTNFPVENIYWPTGEATFGSYLVQVHYYKNCGGQLEIPFIVEILIDGELQVFEDTISTVDQFINIMLFER